MGLGVTGTKGARHVQRVRGARGAIAAAVAVVGLAVLSACTGVTYAETPVPAKPTTTTPAPGTTPTPAACTNATQSYAALPAITASASITNARMREIISRGYLVVGVSADTKLFAARDPFTGRIEGFDIDIAREIARTLFGSPDKIQLRVITATDRLPLLEKREVDIVVRNMTMTCDRWERIAFSAEYYHSGQKVLVAKGSTAQTLADLKGKRVCAPAGTSSLQKLQSVKGPIPVTAANHTGCLVLFQQGKADAITGDDTVLAGLAAQDPYTVVTKAPPITAEPYGVGFNKDDVYFVRYVNAILDGMKKDGRWKAIYTTWLAGPLGPAPAPPTSVYGR
jgi:polar amino acid transport system substrate-binding protein